MADTTTRIWKAMTRLHTRDGARYAPADDAVDLRMDKGEAHQLAKEMNEAVR